MSTVERGIVKFFNGDKKFGFVTVLDAEGNPTTTELFFHYNNGWFLREGTAAPEFRYETGTLVGDRVRHIKAPEKGVELVFTRGSNAKGEKVAMWGYAAQYDEIVQIIANRPVYRVLKFATYHGVSTENTLWKGQNIMELSAKLPKRERFGRVSDDLAAGTADGGDMYWHYAIEQQQPDGSWKICDDPRVFVCCVPRHIFREHGSHTTDQGRCGHGNR